MARLWTRIVMAMIFVFVTISSPLHAQATPMHEHAAKQPAAQSMLMAGMSDACVKAMMAGAAKAKPHKSGMDGHSGGCCADGCNCPLSHCPATPPILAGGMPVEFHGEHAVVPADAQPSIKSYLADTLKRPPRA